MTASAAQVGARSGGATAANESVPVAQAAGAGATAARTAAPPTIPPPAVLSRGSSPARVPAIPTRCPRCTKPAEHGFPFCGYCGTRIAPAGAGMCTQCGASFLQGVDLFCARCGDRVGQRVSVELVRDAAPGPNAGTGTQGMLAARRDTQP